MAAILSRSQCVTSAPQRNRMRPADTPCYALRSQSIKVIRILNSAISKLRNQLSYWVILPKVGQHTLETDSSTAPNITRTNSYQAWNTAEQIIPAGYINLIKRSQLMQAQYSVLKETPRILFRCWFCSTNHGLSNHSGVNSWVCCTCPFIFRDRWGWKSALLPLPPMGTSILKPMGLLPDT